MSSSVPPLGDQLATFYKDRIEEALAIVSALPAAQKKLTMLRLITKEARTHFEGRGNSDAVLRLSALVDHLERMERNFQAESVNQLEGELTRTIEWLKAGTDPSQWLARQDHP